MNLVSQSTKKKKGWQSSFLDLYKKMHYKLAPVEEFFHADFDYKVSSKLIFSSNILFLHTSRGHKMLVITRWLVSLIESTFVSLCQDDEDVWSYAQIGQNILFCLDHDARWNLQLLNKSKQKFTSVATGISSLSSLSQNNSYQNSF